ncbi:hypothetical protein FACS189428_3100 [Clostridia bacterium]|nr:hypothetical protein FACS189428_3100 [Clostridia bacterium]
MNKKFILMLFLCCLSTQIFSQFRSGLILGGGINHPWNGKLNTNLPMVQELLEWNTNCEFFTYSGYNASLGYKFRLEPKPNSFFYDIDLFLGFKSYGDAYYYDYYDSSGSYRMRSHDERKSDFYTSLNLSANYRINKRFYAGAGLEPTVYNMNHEGFKRSFDMPVTSKIGVDLKYVELALSYKIGFLNTLDSRYHKSLNLNDLQLQLFIPF